MYLYQIPFLSVPPPAALPNRKPGAGSCSCRWLLDHKKTFLQYDQIASMTAESSHARRAYHRHPAAADRLGSRRHAAGPGGANQRGGTAIRLLAGHGLAPCASECAPASPDHGGACRPMPGSRGADRGVARRRRRTDRATRQGGQHPRGDLAGRPPRHGHGRLPGSPDRGGRHALGLRGGGNRRFHGCGFTNPQPFQRLDRECGFNSLQPVAAGFTRRPRAAFPRRPGRRSLPGAPASVVRPAGAGGACASHGGWP